MQGKMTGLRAGPGARITGFGGRATETVFRRRPNNGRLQRHGHLKEIKMIRHIVLTKFKPETDEAAITALYAALSALTDTLPGAHNFTAGRSESPEHLDKGFKHALVIDFDTWADLKIYADHPEHKALAAQLVQGAVGGLDGLLVVDFPI